MTKINFKDRNEQIEIADKTYTICVSKYDFIKKAQDNLAELEEAQKTLMDGGGIDKLMSAIESLVNLVLDNDYERIWKACDKDVYAMLDVVNALAEIIKKGFEYKAQKYV